MRIPIHVILVALIVLNSGCGGGSSVPGWPYWPPETPRHPERLAVPFPGIEDPQEWWRLNLFDAIPQETYVSQEQAEFARQIIEETNRVRVENGLQPVEEVVFLDKVAQAHARDQAIRDYWSHKTPEGLGSWLRMEAAGDRKIATGGENSSIGNYGVRTPEHIVNEWLHHTGHRELLLQDDVKYIGIGIYNYHPDEHVYYVQLLVDFQEAE